MDNEKYSNMRPKDRRLFWKQISDHFPLGLVVKTSSSISAFEASCSYFAPAISKAPRLYIFQKVYSITALRKQTYVKLFNYVPIHFLKLVLKLRSGTKPMNEIQSVNKLFYSSR